MKMERATFGAGCFWDAEYAYSHVKGVVSTTVGYMGGSYPRPSYRDVCSGRTGHVEVVEIVFDPTVVSYDYLLELFWNIHNPAQHNPGEQFRSTIFYHTPEQRDAAARSKNYLESTGKHEQPIQTEILPVSHFYRAEEYHQQYLRKRSSSNQHRSAGSSESRIIAEQKHQ